MGGHVCGVRVRVGLLLSKKLCTDDLVRRAKGLWGSLILILIDNIENVYLKNENA